MSPLPSISPHWIKQFSPSPPEDHVFQSCDPLVASTGLSCPDEPKTWHRSPEAGRREVFLYRKQVLKTIKIKQTNKQTKVHTHTHKKNKHNTNTRKNYNKRECMKFHLTFIQTLCSISYIFYEWILPVFCMHLKGLFLQRTFVTRHPFRIKKPGYQGAFCWKAAGI